mmetsp:Transcript_24367/g.35756  ORF Transcript_24367/g.35756 Transcript_24367/m.35756 type:complete len:218 (+) Transcript_24367:44-697(+)
MSKQKLNELFSQREALEIEADAIASQLNSVGPNGAPPPGVKGSLCDSEGFPRADIDLYEVRRKRNRLAVINTDYNLLMKEIGNELAAIHSGITDDDDANETPEIRPAEVSEPALEGVSDRKRDADSVILIPIAVIDEILPESPAHSAGLVDGDLLLAFGTIDHRTQSPMNAIPRVVMDNKDKSIDIVVRRNNTEISLTLVPTTWAGRGLLGCHLSPV